MATMAISQVVMPVNKTVAMVDTTIQLELA